MLRMCLSSLGEVMGDMVNSSTCIPGTGCTKMEWPGALGSNGASWVLFSWIISATEGLTRTK